MQRPTRKIPGAPTTTTPPRKSTTPDSRPTKAEIDELVNQVTDLVGKSPDKAGKILENWLDVRRQPSRKKAA